MQLTNLPSQFQLMYSDIWGPSQTLHLTFTDDHLSVLGLPH